MNTAKKNDLGWAFTILRSYLLTIPSHRWSTQGEIAGQTGLNGVTVRQLCQQYPTQFVSSTSGYKLTRYATRRQVQHCVATLLSRSDKMIRRASALSRVLAA